MSAIFHLVSALVLATLVVLFLKAQRQRDLLRALLGTGAARRRAIVDTPTRFLERVAAAAGIAFENEATRAGDLGPMPARAVGELFMASGVELITCRDGQGSKIAVEVHVANGHGPLPLDNLRGQFDVQVVLDKE